MRLFIDANVLVSVVNKEYPLFTHASRILSLVDKKEYQLYTSPLCLAIVFYFAQKKNKRTAKEKIKLLAQHLLIAPITATEVQKAATDKAIHDFEDGMEYHSALAAQCDCIITEDVGDFYFSSIEVVNCADFFKTYLVEGNKSYQRF